MIAPREESSLLSSEDVRDELYRLFGAGDGTHELVVSVYGGEDDEGVVATYRELMESLYQHGRDDFNLPDAIVQVPDAQMLERALLVLSRPDLQRELFDRVLTSFGHQFIDPLERILDTRPEGALMAELVRVRECLRKDVEQLSVSRETRGILHDDLMGLLDDDYLKMLADNEEKVLRPRARELAQQILRLIGDTFYRAFSRWPSHAHAIAESATRRLGAQVPIRELPNLVRSQLVDGIEEFLWVETSNDIEGALQAVYRAHQDLTEGVPVVERGSYHDFCCGCWEILAKYS